MPFRRQEHKSREVINSKGLFTEEKAILLLMRCHWARHVLKTRHWRITLPAEKISERDIFSTEGKDPK